MDNHNVSHENQDAASFQPTNWDMCALCQKNTKEKLQCPANARQTNQGSTYVTLAENLTKFGECGALSPGFLTRLDDGDGVEETFMKKKASFHLSCRLKYNTTKLKRKLASCDPGEESVPDKKVTRREQRSSGDGVVVKDLSCFLCGKKAPAKDLRHASTFKLDERIRNCALILQDSHLLAKLSRGDVIAQELKYHPACLTSLYRKAQPKVDWTDQRSDQIRKALVFAELTEYIEEVKHSSTGDNLKVLKLADLSKMYLSRLREVGIETGCLHSSRLKTRLLAHFPDLQAHNSGRDILLTFTGISSLLPLFPENSKSPAMMKHAMDLVMQAVKFLNPGQIPVITADQPLFAIAKQIQWKCPESYGESKITLLLGGLHIEMSFLKTVGTLLKDSGWVEALVNAKVATSGCAESFLTGSHVTRTRRAHQLTACALFMLLKHAYKQYSLSCAALEENVLCFEDWKESMITTSPTFKYWTLILQLEMILLVFVASLRDGNFTLYLQTLEELTPWFFALDQQNYGRWLSVHIHDMKKLQGGSSMCYEDLLQGRFVLQKTSRPFSKMALDQAHEQNNAIIKGEGGAVGLTENPSALRRWMVGGPEVSRVLQDLELSFEIKHSKESDQHHEQDKGFQEKFKADVCRLLDVIQETGNPFLEKSAELVTLHDNNIVDAAVHKTLSNIHKTGVAQYNEFTQERLVNMTKPVSAPIKRNNFILIAGAKRKKRSAPQYRISSLKSDCYLFSRLYVACQTRNGGLTDFFSYENQSAPPSLSCEGRMRVSSKSGLLECLEPLQTSSAVPTVTKMTILDGAAVVNMLRPGSARTFADYANQVFIPYVMQTLQNVSHRLDVVWDCYRSDSLKAFTRERRGLEKRKQVTPETVLPSQLGSFLRVDANKTQLFAFLARYLLTVQSQKLIVTTQGPDVISNKPIDHTNLSPCNHEEADTRMMLHLAHAAEHCRRILIRTVDTDVVVLSVAAMTRHPHLELWIAMGTGKDFRYIAAHDISKVLGVARAQCLPLFHSFTGCDTVSCFNGIGKKTAWEVWSKCDHVTATFQKLCCAPFELTGNDMSVLERFVTLLYDRGSNCHDVNSARKYLFTKTGRQIENIPPTRQALFQHCKRAIYQGGHIWSQAHEQQPVLPDPSEWGWQLMDRQWQPFWTVLPQASMTCRELLKCACKKECRSKRCKCNKAGLKCTALCSCVCGADFSVQHPVQASNTN